MRYKFRAWDKRTNEMFYDSLPLKLLAQAASGVESIHKTYDFMQWTGLTDRNGKLIYEGDVLKISDRHSPQIVHFNPEGYYSTDEFALFELNRDKGRMFEVIGNIHENPELINS